MLQRSSEKGGSSKVGGPRLPALIRKLQSHQMVLVHFPGGTDGSVQPIDQPFEADVAEKCSLGSLNVVDLQPRVEAFWALFYCRS